MNFCVGEFVEVKLLSNDLKELGVCKLDHFDDEYFTLSFFESTLNESILKRIPIQDDFDTQEYMSET